MVRSSATVKAANWQSHGMGAYLYSIGRKPFMQSNKKPTAARVNNRKPGEVCRDCGLAIVPPLRLYCMRCVRFHLGG
jgi:hypothetical protein